MCVNNSTWHIAYIIVIWKGTPLFKTYMVLDWSLNVLERYFYTTILPYIGRCSQWFAILQWPSLISKPLQPLVKRDTSTHASSVKGYSASYSHGWWIRHMFNSCFGVGMARCGLDWNRKTWKIITRESCFFFVSRKELRSRILGNTSGKQCSLILENTQAWRVPL